MKRAQERVNDGAQILRLQGGQIDQLHSLIRSFRMRHHIGAVVDSDAVSKFHQASGELVDRCFEPTEASGNRFNPDHCNADGMRFLPQHEEVYAIAMCDPKRVSRLPTKIELDIFPSDRFVRLRIRLMPYLTDGF